MKKIFLLILASFAFTNAVANEICDRSERTADYTGDLVPIKAAVGQFTEIKFDNSILGVNPEIPDGIVIDQNITRDIPNILLISVSRPDYSGKLLVHDKEGYSYNLHIKAKPGCADSLVKVRSPRQSDEEMAKKTVRPIGTKGRKRLMEYMLLGAKSPPPGYRIEKAQGDRATRQIGRQGPVDMYLEKVYRGQNYTGFEILMVNKGRAPFRVQIEAIDYESEYMRNTFGRVKEVSMLPTSLRLAPQPQYATSAFTRDYMGILYIVVENS